jgi:hypothetical protein
MAWFILVPRQLEDAESGLHCNRNRFQDLGTGQYLLPDPMERFRYSKLKHGIEWKLSKHEVYNDVSEK